MGIPPIPAAMAILISNEQTKLLANALDRASTALGAGSLWPAYNLFGRSNWPDSWRGWAASGYGVTCFVLECLALHYFANRTLKRLR
jgi:hypothetical protein